VYIRTIYHLLFWASHFLIFCTTNDEIVTQIKNSKEISEDFLPTKGEFFEISNQKIQKYITSLEKQLIKIDTVDTV
jgi:hypothetical protein